MIMKKKIFFHETSGFYLPRSEVYNGFTNTLDAIKRGDEVIHTTQIALMNFRYTKEYDMYLLLNPTLNDIDYTVIHISEELSIGTMKLKEFNYDTIQMYIIGLFTNKTVLKAIQSKFKFKTIEDIK